MILHLINNVALLVMLAVGLQMLSRYLADESMSYKVLAGLLFSFVGIIAMTTAFELRPGLLFDGRSIVVGLAGLFGGPVVVAFPAVICSGYRISLGGEGAPIGVVSIVVVAIFGVFFHYLSLHNKNWLRPLRLFGIGFSIHAFLLGLFFLLPGMTPGQVLRDLGPNFLLLHPTAFLVLSLVILEGERRQQAEQALRRSEQNYRNLFEYHTAIKLIIDLEDGHILDANHAAANYYGWSCGALKEKTIFDLDTAPREKVLTTLRDREGKTHLIAQHRHADDSLHDVKIFASEIFFEDKLYLHAIVLDATHEKVLEEQLRQAQKMEAIGHLAGGIAHDFNNILQTMMGYTQLLKRALSVEEQSPEKMSVLEKQTEYLEHISRSCSYAASLTRQLLTFSRRQIMQTATLNINTVTEDLLKLLRRFLGEHIQLEFAPTEKPNAIVADVGMIEQILMNLALNARDAMPKGGKLHIITRNVVLDAAYCDIHPWAKPGRYVLLQVADTGCGMDHETQKRIFEPFFTTKEPGKGTGLGLATVYGIIKQHQGMVHVYSEPGRGTVFNVYFPAVDKALQEEQPPGEEVIPQGGDETILLAEDNDMVRGLAVHILEDAGYTVVEACNGADAVKQFEANAPSIDLLLFDVVMPELNGHDAYERIHAIQPKVPVLFSSGYNENIIQANFVLKKGVQLIQKPYAPSILLKSVRHILDNARATPA